MSQVLLNPPSAGQNVSEWAKQPACRKTGLEAHVKVVSDFDDWTVSRDQHRADNRQKKATGRIDEGLAAIQRVMEYKAPYWEALRKFCLSKRLLSPEDGAALNRVCRSSIKVPDDRQAARLIRLISRAEEAGWSHEG